MNQFIQELSGNHTKLHLKSGLEAMLPMDTKKRPPYHTRVIYSLTQNYIVRVFSLNC